MTLKRFDFSLCFVQCTLYLIVLTTIWDISCTYGQEGNVTMSNMTNSTLDQAQQQLPPPMDLLR